MRITGAEEKLHEDVPKDERPAATAGHWTSLYEAAPSRVPLSRGGAGAANRKDARESKLARFASWPGNG